jgi:hypothetical protein
VTRLQVWFLHITIALVTLTGVLLAWMKYGMKSDDPFSVVNHPMQPGMLAAHVLVAPVALFGLGWVFSTHIVPKFRSGAKPQRRSGLSSMWLIAPMVMSGYVLQVVTSDGARHWTAVTHWSTSAVFLIAYVIHQIRD